MHLMNPHGPYRVPAARRAALLGEPPGRAFRWGSRRMRAILQGREGPEPELEPAVRASLVDQYDTAVRYALDEVGAQLDLLRHAGVYEDSLVVLTSDNGEELFDHHGFDHGYTLYGEVLRVPLYVKRPGPPPATGAGLRVDGRVSLMDVVPTVLDLLGLPPVEGAGVSLVPLLDGAPGDRKRTLHYHTAWRTRADARAVVSGRYKLIETRFDARGARNRTQLFDLTLDPEERNDLYGQGEEIAERLAAEAESAFAGYRGAGAREAP